VRGLLLSMATSMQARQFAFDQFPEVKPLALETTLGKPGIDPPLEKAGSDLLFIRGPALAFSP
jgi:hypothetical protein